MDKQKPTSECSFHSRPVYPPIHSRIIRQNEDTLIIEEGNTIYEIDKNCARKHGYLKMEQANSSLEHK